jgi:hypothetical protein
MIMKFCRALRRSCWMAASQLGPKRAGSGQAKSSYRTRLWKARRMLRHGWALDYPGSRLVHWMIFGREG